MIDAQDRAVVAGTNDEAGSSPGIALARLTTGGQPDTSFSGDGQVIHTAVGISGKPGAEGLAIDAAGGLVVPSNLLVGCPGIGCSLTGAVSRFSAATGDLDAGWAVGGTRQIGAAGQRVVDVAAAPGGGVYAAGWRDYETWTVARLTAGGALDTGYDGDGIAESDVGKAPADLIVAFALAVDAQGRAIVSGQGQLTGSGTPTLVRFTTTGAPDPAFGNGSPAPGVVVVPGTSVGRATGVRTCGSRVIVAGHTNLPNTLTSQMFVAAFEGGGTPVAAFAASGPTPGVKTVALGNNAQATDLAIAGAGVLVIGFRSTNPPYELFPVVQRFLAACGDEVAPPPLVPPTPAPAAPAATPPPPPAAPAAAAVRVATVVGFPSTRACVSRRRFAIRLRVPREASVVQATVLVNGKQVAVRKGARLRSTVNLRSLPKGRFRVEVRLRLADGRTVKDNRRYRTCVPKKRR